MDPAKALKSMAELEEGAKQAHDIRTVANMFKAIAPAFGISPRIISDCAYSIACDGGTVDTFIAAIKDPAVGMPEYVGISTCRPGNMHAGWRARDVLDITSYSVFGDFISSLVDGRGCMIFKPYGGAYWVLHNLDGWASSNRPRVLIPSNSSSVESVVLTTLKFFMEDRLCLTS